MNIIGITGTLGAGKGTIVDYLIEKKGYQHFSVRGYLTRVIIERGLPVNRDSMVAVANELRQNHSPSFIVEELYKQAGQSGKDCVIESIRTVGEVKALKQKGNFYLFAVDADRLERYKRIQQRASETDFIDYNTFVQNEEREMNSTDPNKQNLSACMALADYRFDNNGTVTDLYQQVDHVITQINQ